MPENHLKVYREKAGMTQAELAEKAGLSRATIIKIESNEEVNVNTQTIAKICKALNAAPRDIFLF